MRENGPDPDSKDPGALNEESWSGRTISHYRIVSRLGSGGMGVVYRAVDLLLDRDVAIKFLPPGGSADTDLRRRLFKEAKSASALNHPNIITIYEIASEQNVDYIVMEFVDGATLEESIYAQPRELKETLRQAAQIADALAAAHAKGIVHRDIKPANIMLTQSGLIKVLDFGLAQLRTEVDSPEQTRTVLTGTGAVLGTWAYMSPEQARGEDVDQRSDIFSFGVVLYEMLTMRRPFAGATAVAALSATLTRNPEPASMVAKDIPARFDALIMGCLAKQPEDRIQTMTDVKDALQIFLADPMHSWTAPAPRIPQRPVEPAAVVKQRRWPLFASAAALLALLTGSALYWNMRHPAAEFPSIPVLTRVTGDSGLTAFPAISQDGKLVAFASDRAGEGNLDIWVRQTAGADPIRLTQDPADEYEPDFSRDATRIVYRSEKDGGGIYTIPALGGRARLIAREGHRPRWSPDSSRVAYWTGFPGPNFHPGTSKVFVVPSGGGPARQVGTEFAAIRHPMWLPTGSRLLVVGRFDSAESVDWWMLDLEGGKPVRTGAFAKFAKNRLSAPPLAEVITPDAVTRDGEVLFSATSGDATNIWRMPLNMETGRISGNPLQISAGTGLELQPAVAGLSGSVVFSALALNVNVWTLNVDANTGRAAGQPRPITRQLSFDAWPSLSANGDKLAFASYQSGKGAVMARDLATGQELPLTAPAAGESQPKVSFDGRYVAYGNAQEHSGYVVSFAGGVPEKVCERCILPCGWHPGGRHILFEQGNGFQPLSLVELGTGKRQDFIRSADGKMLINSGNFSPDGAWVAFHVREQPTARQIFVAPAVLDHPPDQSQWIPVTDGKNMDREAVWSPDGNLIYFLSDRDTFRCIWAQRLEPSTKRPAGAPFAVWHFHHSRESLTAVGSNVGAIGLSVARDKLVFSLGEITGNVWVRETLAR